MSEGAGGGGEVGGGFGFVENFNGGDEGESLLLRRNSANALKVSKPFNNLEFHASQLFYIRVLLRYLIIAKTRFINKPAKKVYTT